MDSSNGVIVEDSDEDPEVTSMMKDDVLQQVRILIRENILPRLTDLEEQVRLLRKVTWPVCQGQKETSQLGDIMAKREFLKDLDPQEIWMLLKSKSNGKLHVNEEFDAIMSSTRYKKS
jgi:hypothetical protein